ncbi:UDP-N-acetylmuramoyl-tripeptide--D-alanyl-D-alanine ligase [Pseudoclavibacter triregionum]|nr:UDP-N-acetylmuramoyl-tripeptide--D-alanyl-D-alanine ligase [Pseudoclavibacter triregionum]
MRYAIPVAIGRAVRVAARIRKPGGGSAIPGVVVNRIAPGYLRATLDGFPGGLAIVTGSSGKSTTTKMLVEILRAHGADLFTNPSTANIAQGLTSAVIEQADWKGEVAGEIGVLEMDEGHGAVVTRGLSPKAVVLTNVMVDQIDRFHDPEMVAEMLRKIASRATGAVAYNADDALLLTLVAGLDASVERLPFGASRELVEAAPHGLGLAQTAAERLPDGTGVRLVALDGRRATLEVEGAPLELTMPARGLHYGMDAAGAIAGALAILGRDRFDLATAKAAFERLEPVFGRGEQTVVRGKTVEFVLVQNPASLQLNIDGLDEGLEQVLFAVGSDVRDESYLWSTDLARLGRVQIVTGSKAHDAALHLAYDDVEIERVEPDLHRALDDFLAQPEPSRGVKTIIFTADAMRRTRLHLGLAGGDKDAAPKVGAAQKGDAS